ncbi:MAG: signal transduction protein [Candidatus Tectimicrobiota bacterium]|nr:MAG: signal transduction protein [Candidatus Tectomicrobia bacterium]
MTAASEPVKKRVLFVDDEPNVLQALRRMLHTMRQEWEMAFASSGEEALRLLAEQPFDVIVSDMRMPGMDGVQLLTRVMEQYPGIVRIVLSGHSDRDMILRSVKPAHQYLAKPCDAERLKATVARACALRELLADQALQRLVSGVKTLPSLPTLYTEVIAAIQAPDSSLEEVGQIIEQDMAMSAKILQLVNSAFFGLRRHVASPTQAVCLLGLNTVQALVLSVQIFAHFDQAVLRRLALDTLWQHSLATSVCAKQIAADLASDRTTVDHAFMAGLLHDVGQLLLAANVPEAYGRALALAHEASLPLWEAEQAVFGATHAEVGAYLLGLWGLPDAIVEAVAYHHRPAACLHQAFSPLAAVHVADALVREAEAGGGEDTGLNPQYVAALGLAERLAEWRVQCQGVPSPA